MRKFIVFIAAIIFAFIGTVIFLMTYKESSAQKAPIVTLLGTQSHFSSEILSKLPPGYSKDIRGLTAIDFDITVDPDDPVALFSINPDKPNIDAQLEYAMKVGKKEVYFFVMEHIENPFLLKIPFYDIGIDPRFLSLFGLPPVL